MNATNATGAPKSPIYPSPEYQKRLDALQQQFANLTDQINLLQFATDYAFSVATDCNINAVKCAVGNVSHGITTLKTHINDIAEIRGAV